MSLLGKKDGQSNQTSYLDLVDLIRGYGSRPNEEIMELFRRVVFNIAVSNTGDHLRNHGFLYEAGGWYLSPVYDLNPVSYGTNCR